MSAYYETLNDYLNYFKKEFGERKYRKVENKIFNSNKVSNLIKISKERFVVPNQNDYIPMLHEIPFFIFANRDVIAAGAILALERWNLECNSDLQLASDFELKIILQGIFNEIKQI
jgi:hypothetical protein